jgi:poly(3-hydroxybutyrate) depolymerase
MNVEGILPIDSKKLVQIRDFEQMFTLPPPTGLREAKAKLGSGYPNTWYEYVPQSYTGDERVPLIVQLHGGGNDGRRWANLTIWHLLAEKHGFIVVYPTP